MLQGKESDSASTVNDTLDCAFIYMFFITLSIFPEIREDNILDHRVVLLIVSIFFHSRLNSIIVAYAYLDTYQLVILKQIK